MSRILYIPMVIVGLLVTALPAMSEETLDPSIFDGTGREQREVPEETESAEPSPPAEDEGTKGKDEKIPAVSGAGKEATEEAVPEEKTGTVGGEEEAKAPLEEPLEDPASPGSPAEVMTESRAGERVESSETIAPGQAVDFPWDM
ncbi:MAG: hypothetical protein WD708_12260 [Kiritimatiellia bacterium]